MHIHTDPKVNIRLKDIDTQKRIVINLRPASKGRYSDRTCQDFKIQKVLSPMASLISEFWTDD